MLLVAFFLSDFERFETNALQIEMAEGKIARNIYLIKNEKYIIAITTPKQKTSHYFQPKSTH
jgi:hypothetical protein